MLFRLLFIIFESIYAANSTNMTRYESKTMGKIPWNKRQHQMQMTRNYLIECASTCSASLNCNVFTFDAQNGLCELGWVVELLTLPTTETIQVFALESLPQTDSPLHMMRLEASDNGNSIDDFNALRSAPSAYLFPAIPLHLNTWHQMEVALYKDNNIILCGGRLASSTTTNCLQHEVGSSTWTSFDMLVPRISFALIFVNERLWALGGQNGGSSEIATTEAWDGLFWEMGPDLPRAMTGHGAVQVDQFHCMIIGGGSDLNNALKDTYLYDTRLTSALAFTQRAHLNVARSFAFASLIQWSDGQDRVVVAGGTIGGYEESLTTIEIYDIALDVWTLIPGLLPFPYSRGNIVTTHNVMFLVGGQTNASEAASEQVVSIDNDGTIRLIFNCSSTYSTQSLRVLGFRYS